MTPIIVLGFGRSGSTWVGDVIAELAGGIMLNEPLNPCMGFLPEDLGPDQARRRHDHHPAAESGLYKITSGQVRDPWLLRGVFAPLATADHREIAAYWDSKPIVGFKETFHAAWSIDWLVRVYGRRLAYVWRDPYATIASVLARPSFWALGWPAHGEAVLRAAGRSWGPARSYVERVATVWAYAHEAVLDSLERNRLPIFDYEDLCHSSESAGRRHALAAWDALVEHLDLDGGPINFTPSRTTGAPRAGLSVDDELAIMPIVADVEERRAAYVCAS